MAPIRRRPQPRTTLSSQIYFLALQRDERYSRYSHGNLFDKLPNLIRPPHLMSIAPPFEIVLDDTPSCPRAGQPPHTRQAAKASCNKVRTRAKTMSIALDSQRLRRRVHKRVLKMERPPLGRLFLSTLTRPELGTQRPFQPVVKGEYPAHHRDRQRRDIKRLDDPLPLQFQRALLQASASESCCRSFLNSRYR